MGIKGASILSSHMPFDMCAGVVIDMMHCVFLGVIGKSLMKFWFGSSHAKPFSLRRKVWWICFFKTVLSILCVYMYNNRCLTVMSGCWVFLSLMTLAERRGVWVTLHTGKVIISCVHAPEREFVYACMYVCPYSCMVCVYCMFVCVCTQHIIVIIIIVVVTFYSLRVLLLGPLPLSPCLGRTPSRAILHPLFSPRCSYAHTSRPITIISLFADGWKVPTSFLWDAFTSLW